MTGLVRDCEQADHRQGAKNMTEMDAVVLQVLNYQDDRITGMGMHS